MTLFFFISACLMISFFSERSTGGRCLSVEYTDKVGELAKKHGLKLHIDGARIFNAAVVSDNYLEMILDTCIVLTLTIMVAFILFC